MLQKLRMPRNKKSQDVRFVMPQDVVGLKPQPMCRICCTEVQGQL